MRRKMATYYAAHPGPERDVYMQINAEQADNLRRARARFVSVLTHLAANPHSLQTTDHLLANPDHRWAYNAAVWAKHMVEHKHLDDIELYYADHLDHKAFLEAAREAHARAATTTPGQNPAPAPIASTSARNPSPAPTPSTSTMMTVSTSLTNGDAGPNPVANIDSGSAEAAHNESSSSNTAIERAGMVNGHVTHPQLPNGDSQSTTIDHSASTVGEGSLMGMLTATFYDIAGVFLGHRQVPIAAPVQVTMNINSSAGAYDPLQLASRLEDMARMMQVRDQGDEQVEGAVLTEDGLWEEA